MKPKKTWYFFAGSEKKTKPAQPSVLWNNGFISVYGLLFLLSITSLATILLDQWIERAKIMENIRQANVYLSQEAAALAYLKCALKNNDVQHETVDYAGVSFEIIPATPLQIRIDAPFLEILEVELQNNTVYEYTFQRPMENTR